VVAPRHRPSRAAGPYIDVRASFVGRHISD